MTHRDRNRPRDGRTAWEGRGRRITLVAVALIAIGALWPVVWSILTIPLSYVLLWIDPWFIFECGGPIVLSTLVVLAFLWFGVRRVTRSLPGRPSRLHMGATSRETVSPSLNRGRRGQS